MKLLFEDYCRVDRTIYFIAKNVNLLCAMDLNSGEINPISSIPGRDIYAYQMGGKIIAIDDRLYCFPMANNRIWIFDLINKTWEPLEIDDKGIKELFFVQAIEFKENIYVIGCHPDMIKINLRDDSVEYIKDLYCDELNKQGSVRSDYVIIEDVLYMADVKSNRVLKYNLKNDDYTWIYIGNKNNCYSGIAYDGSFFYLSPRNDTNIVRWDGKNEVTEVELPDFYKGKEFSFLGAVDIGKNVMFPGHKIKKTIIMEKSDLSLVMLDENFTFYKKISDEKYFFQNYEGELKLIDHENTILFKVCEIPDCKFYAEVAKHHKYQDYFQELHIETNRVDFQLYLALV